MPSPIRGGPDRLGPRTSARNELLHRLLPRDGSPEARQNLARSLETLPDQVLKKMVEEGVRYRWHGGFVDRLQDCLRPRSGSHNRFGTISLKEEFFQSGSDHHLALHETGHVVSRIAGGNARELKESFHKFVAEVELAPAVLEAKLRGTVNGGQVGQTSIGEVDDLRVATTPLPGGRVEIVQQRPLRPLILRAFGVASCLAATWLPSPYSLPFALAVGVLTPKLVKQVASLFVHRDTDLGEAGRVSVRGRTIRGVVDPDRFADLHRGWIRQHHEHIASEIEEYYAEGFSAYFNPNGIGSHLARQDPELKRVIEADLQNHFGYNLTPAEDRPGLGAAGSPSLQREA